jgi:K+-sensing histidine kinase KdpD
MQHKQLLIRAMPHSDALFKKINRIGIEVLQEGKLLLAPLDAVSDSNRFQFKTEIISLSQVYKKALSELSEEFEAKNVRLSESIDDTALKIKADAESLQLVLKNLMYYALSFAKNNGKLSVRIKQSDTIIYFQVVNKANGITAAEMDGYFKELQAVTYQKNNTLTGAQFDLSLSKKITEEMGGHFKYVSSIDLGYEFRIQFNTYNYKN